MEQQQGEFLVQVVSPDGFSAGSSQGDPAPQLLLPCGKSFAENSGA